MPVSHEADDFSRIKASCIRKTFAYPAQRSWTCDNEFHLGVVDNTTVVQGDLLFGPDSIDVMGDWFTEEELAGAPTNDPNKTVYLSGQIAAKEAIVKALGTGLIADMTWPEIEILRDQAGAPRVVLSGAVEATASALKVSQWFVSISHTDDYAIASAIALVQASSL